MTTHLRGACVLQPDFFRQRFTHTIFRRQLHGSGPPCLSCAGLQTYFPPLRLNPAESSKLSSDLISCQMNWFGPAQTNPDKSNRCRGPPLWGSLTAAWAVSLKVKLTLHRLFFTHHFRTRLFFTGSLCTLFFSLRFSGGVLLESHRQIDCFILTPLR